MGKVGWQTVHVFVSSTFNDMHAERDYLVKQVFPRLRDWCERRRLRLVDIDLRWGVTETDATRNKNVVQVCLDKIDECRPFFVCLLGQRYGWIPREGDIAPETFLSFTGLAAAVDEQRSVTDIEVLHAASRPLHGASRAEHAFFYLRDPSYLSALPTDPALLGRTYTDGAETDPASREFLTEKQRILREVEIPATGRPVCPYWAEWDATQRTPELELPLCCASVLPENQQRWRQSWKDLAGVEVSDLDLEQGSAAGEDAARFNEALTAGRLTRFSCDGAPLGEVILADLQQSIADRFPGHSEHEPISDLERELDQQARFRFAAAEGFIEREGDFDALNAFAVAEIRQPTTEEMRRLGTDRLRQRLRQVGGPKVFVLTAGAGMGKTTLLAWWLEVYGPEQPGAESAEQQRTVHSRFIGASDGSTSLRGVLRSLLLELQVSGKLKAEAEIPYSLPELMEAWPELLKQAGASGPTVIVLDALDQLDTEMVGLTWLTRDLHQDVKLVLSLRHDDEDGAALRSLLAERDDVLLAEVRPFESIEDRRALVQAYLSQYLKELDEAHLEALIASQGASNPLFLKVVLSELRVFGAFSDLGRKIREDFGESPRSAFEAVLRRLEADPAHSEVPGGVAVPLLFGLLAHARRGLSVEELVELLRLEFELDRDRQEGLRASVELFLRQVRPFLARREGRFDFFYQSFALAARARYVAKEPPAVWHGRLAGYFGGLRLLSRRKVSELPFHLTEAKRWDDLADTLTDLEFVEAKVQARMATELQADYQRALARLPEARAEQVQAFGKFVSVELHHLAQAGDYPGFCLQQAHNHSDYAPLVQQARRRLRKQPDVAVLLRPAYQLPPHNPYPACLRTLTEHLNVVVSVSLSADATLAVSGSWDKTVRVWEVGTGRCLRELEGHEGKINAVSLNANGSLAASVCSEGVIRYWEVSTGRCVRTRKTTSGWIWDLCLSADGRLAITGGQDRCLRVWDVETGKLKRTMRKHVDQINALSLSADGSLAASAGRDQTVRIWELGSGKCLHTLQGHQGDLVGVSLSADATRVASASTDATLRLWDVGAGACLRTMGSLAPSSGRDQP